jgi:PAS domain S-box-containing protein
MKSFLKGYGVTGFVFGFVFPVFGTVIYSVKFEQPVLQVLTQMDPFRFMVWLAPIVLGVAGFWFDKVKKALTEKSEAEFRLEEAEKMASLGIWSFNLQNQKMTWSKELYKIFGLDPQGGPPSFENFLKAIHPDDVASVLESITECQEKGISYNVRHRVLHKGAVRWIDGSGRAILDDNQKIVRLTGVCQDVTAQIDVDEKHVRQAAILAEQIHKLEVLIKNTPGMAFSYQINAEGQSMYTYVSPQVVGIYEIETDQIARDSELLNKMVAPDQKESFHKVLAASHKTLSDFHWVGRIVSGLGNEKWIRVHAIAKSIDNGIVAWDGVVVDITVEKRLEENLLHERQKSLHNSKLASIGEMSAGMAHEINNPLSIISGTVNILPNYLNQPEKFNEKIAAINKSCARISKIVTGLRKFSRSTEEKDFKIHKVFDLLGEVLVLTHARSAKNCVPVTLFGEKTAEVYCDEIEIEQVFVNLVNNAIDAAKKEPEKWVEVHVEIESDFVNVKVKDSGSGIPIEVTQKLFNPFFTTKGVGEGTGLGLSIAKSIVTEHNGKIYIDEFSKNTCFVVSLPKTIVGGV